MDVLLRVRFKVFVVLYLCFNLRIFPCSGASPTQITEAGSDISRNVTSTIPKCCSGSEEVITIESTRFACQAKNGSSETKILKLFEPLENQTLAYSSDDVPKCSKYVYSLLHNLHSKTTNISESISPPLDKKVNISGQIFGGGKEEFASSEFCIDLFLIDNVVIFCDHEGHSSPNLSPSADMGDTTRRGFRLRIICSSGCSFNLLVTIAVYILLPHLLNLHGKCVLSYVISLFMAYSSLMASHIGVKYFNRDTCRIVGLLKQYSFLAASTWLVVMSFDILTKLRSLRSMAFNGQRKDLKRFIRYSLAAWLAPLPFCALAIILDALPGLIPSDMLPEMGAHKCWFNNEMPLVLLFYFPVSILLVINVFIFIMTTIHLIRSNKSYETMSDPGAFCVYKGQKKCERQRFFLYLKLFVIMGLSWLAAKLVAWLVRGSTFLWYISDFVNMLQGQAILVVFVLKKKIWRQLCEKIKCCKREEKYKAEPDFQFQPIKAQASIETITSTISAKL